MDQWKDIERRVARVRRFASWMDDSFSVPGTRIRFGLDSLIGLIPVIGDFATASASVWLVVEAVRIRASTAVLARMASNVLIDLTIGALPVIGDLFDVYWKSNRRNAILLEKHVRKQQERSQ
ncbi:DUF4112 domain-containing protein [Stieleria sp. TO1_6]|uniref:DUF4112 domain-containing protein n=1 Tax=Stieleria tagensis TaxID=2956795 RepID=UPI00209B7206|nr:DUF4112 domain-containing protein [Stieleria tagensis]MCO8121564.1 DUF4112 domain-containing protein [Stieleria tagensis]